jgi:hypothetical protein
VVHSRAKAPPFPTACRGGNQRWSESGRIAITRALCLYFWGCWGGINIRDWAHHIYATWCDATRSNCITNNSGHLCEVRSNGAGYGQQYYSVVYYTVAPLHHLNRTECHEAAARVILRPRTPYTVPRTMLSPRRARIADRMLIAFSAHHHDERHPSTQYKGAHACGSFGSAQFASSAARKLIGVCLPKRACHISSIGNTAASGQAVYSASSALDWTPQQPSPSTKPACFD